MTARHALAELEREGLVDRRRGVRNIRGAAQDPLQPPGQLHRANGQPGLARALADLMRRAGRGGAGGGRAALASRPQPTGEAGTSASIRRTTFALESCYLAAAEFAGLLSHPLERRSLFALLEREYGIALAYADEEVDATAAGARTAELLEIHAGAPVLRIRQAIYSTEGTATVYVIGFYRSDRHTLLIRRFRQ